MPAPFAALEARTNNAVIDHLANAEAVIGGQTVSGIFRRDYAEVISGLAAGANLLFGCRAADVPGIAKGASVQIGADSYAAASVEPDGNGWVVLVLMRA